MRGSEKNLRIKRFLCKIDMFKNQSNEIVEKIFIHIHIL